MVDTLYTRRPPTSDTLLDTLAPDLERIAAGRHHHPHGVLGRALTFHDPKHVTDELVEECYQTVNDKGKLIRILSLAKSAIRHNMAKDLPNLKMPVCLVWGRQDTITPPQVAEEFHSLIPHSDLYWIDKCGHAAMMEHADEFNAFVDKWLAKTLV